MSLDGLDHSVAELHAELVALRQRIAKLRALFELSKARLPDGTKKRTVLRAVGDDRPTLLADGGVENYNSAVDEIVETGRLRRLLAMTEITFSNSLIESWWRTLKNQWLFMNALDSVAAVERLVAFYVTEHNEVLPHSAFRGQTPDEMYSGKGAVIPHNLETGRAEARSCRLEENRRRSCRVCQPEGLAIAI